MRPPLHAHGAARVEAGFGPDPGLPEELPEAVREALRRGELGEEEAHLAWEVARLGGPGDHRARCALLLATQDALSRGSTRVPIDRLAGAIEALGFAEADARAAVELMRRGDAILGPPGSDRPLVVERDHLYQERLHAIEARLARRIAARGLDPRPELLDPRASLEAIAAHPTGAVHLTDEQTRAVRTALEAPLAAISGGPGTGKTSIVVAILRAALHRGPLSPAAIAIAAPTGKAADRLRRAIGGALAAIADPLPTDLALMRAPPTPKTLHRLLGYTSERRAGGFAHHEGNPLSEALVIVDEASMVDVFLMDRLLASLRPSARLVLLGDAEQLPSVAAGAVFRDLLRAAPSVQLTRSHRMDPSRPEGSHILRVAARVNAGEVPTMAASEGGAIAVLARLPEDPSELGGVSLFEPETPLAREAFLDFWLAHRGPRIDLAARAWPLVDGRLELHPELDALFAHAERARLLCVTRSAARPTGVDAINAALHRRYAEALGAASLAYLLPGEPIVVLRNDYERDLFNGDQGLVLRCVDDDGARVCAVFRTEAGPPCAHPLDAVRAIVDLGYATTVHKAQGSEHDEVALVLPETDSPRLLTREIVYTAITRARRAVLVIGSAAILARAAERRIERSTGIAERLLT